MTVEAAATVAAQNRASPRKLGWGLHRLGHFAAESPRLALLLILAMSALAGYGLTRIESTSHSLNALFQSDTDEYRRYEEMRQAFPLNERDIFVVVSSPKPFAPADIEALRELHLELQLLDETESVLSLFSVRDNLIEDGYAAPLIPDELPEGDAFKALMARVAAHPFAAGKLISDNPQGGQTVVIVAGMSADSVSTKNLVEGIDAVTGATGGMLEGTGLKYEFLGVPVMQLDIRLASRDDRWTFNVVGFLIGFVTSLLFFRDVRLVAIATICPAIAVLWSFGLFGLIGFPLTFFMNAVPPLVMVVAFADAMHLAYGVERRLSDGEERASAVHHTVSAVGPACFLTTLTTAVAFSSLLLSDSEAIRDFGFGGSIAIMSVFFVSMLVVPSLSMLILGGRPGAKNAERAAWFSHSGFARASEWLARFVPRHALAIVAVGLVSFFALSALYLNLEPRFRLSEQTPGHLRDRILALDRVAGLATSSPLYVVVGYPEGERPASERLRRVVGQVHDALSGQRTVGQVWSLALFEREHHGSDAALAEAIDALPDNLRARLWNEQARMLLVTGHLPDLDAKEMRSEIAKIDDRLAPLRAENPDLTIAITGIAAVSALHATTMIGDLNKSLLSAILVVMLVIGVAFRSVAVPFVALLPNVLPIVASGALLYVVAGGIDYAGIIALTVAFGLAVDDTIHFLARFRHERATGLDVSDAVAMAIRRVAPVMAITTIVLVCGIGVTVFGQMPQTRAFGAIVIVTLFTALAADLLLAPALILVPKAFRRMLRRA